MFSTIYTGLTGLMGFSKDLDVIGNNITNLNTPGFKSSQLHFQDLFYQYQLGGDPNNDNSGLQVGTGVGTGPSVRQFTQGNLSTTNNPLDVGVNGNGLFIISKDGNILYTRDGQFQVNPDGYLVDQSGNHVLGSNDGQHLYDISIQGLRTNPPVATTKVTFTGNLLPGSGTFSLPSVSILDQSGKSQVLKVTFTDNSAVTPGSWLIAVNTSSAGLTASDVQVASGEIRYQSSGSPQTDFNTFAFDFTPAGSGTSHITFSFGDPGTFSGTTALPTGNASTVSVASEDGYAAGLLSDVAIDDTGHLVLTYSNGQKDQSDRLALAWFDNLQSLNPVGGNLFEDKSGQVRHLGGPGDGIMGKLALKQIELSNVDLTMEFTNIIIAQRGYQASSQVLSVTNEMIQQLFDIKSGR